MPAGAQVIMSPGMGQYLQYPQMAQGQIGLQGQMTQFGQFQMGQLGQMGQMGQMGMPYIIQPMPIGRPAVSCKSWKNQSMEHFSGMTFKFFVSFRIKNGLNSSFKVYIINYEL